MKMKIMSAGPTSVSDRVLEASRKSLTNTDLDQDYISFQRNTERKISKLLHTDETSFIMLGEAMLGLDGAMASFIEPGDRVLVINNGPFGEGFLDMVSRYGGVPVNYVCDLRRGVNVEQLAQFLIDDHDFKLATLIHCETPSGITNDVHAIGPLLNAYGILSIVDTVSAMAGERFEFDTSKVDVAIGGTQKCLSALTGLTTITLSNNAVEYLKTRRTPVMGYYGNFQNYLRTTQGFDFPYTQSDTLVYALDEALNIALGHNFVERHERFAQLTRDRVKAMGYEIYGKDSLSNTVTTVLLKEGQTTEGVLEKMRAQGFVISGAIGEISGKAIRLGHMGNNITDRDAYLAMLDALELVLTNPLVR